MTLRSAIALLATVSFHLFPGCDVAPEPVDAEVYSSASAALSAAECQDAAENGRVSICHATSSSTNPYTLITVATQACLNGHTGHADDVLPDIDGSCCALEDRDCEGRCFGTAELDCAGTCNGAAELDCAGTCNGTAQPDCAGTCNGTAEFDCAGTCNGSAEDVDVVYYTTQSGIFRWTSSSAAAPPVRVSTVPAYSIALSDAGEIVVGTGGLEASAQGLGTPAIYEIDAMGAATLLSTTAAEDLQFAPDGTLHASNSTGIYAIDWSSGAATQVSSNPTSQFAFVSDSQVLTTNGTVYGSAFTRRTDRINIPGGSTTLVNGDGGEDIHVLPDGRAYLCGQGGVFEILPSGALFRISSFRTFNFGFGPVTGDLYVGNSQSYGFLTWPAGLYALEPSAALIASADVNAMAVTAACE